MARCSWNNNCTCTNTKLQADTYCLCHQLILDEIAKYKQWKETKTVDGQITSNDYYESNFDKDIITKYGDLGQNNWKINELFYFIEHRGYIQNMDLNEINRPNSFY
jgi:hypothetical protein